MSTDAAAFATRPARARTAARGKPFLLWLRRVHLYVGLWGALLGLLFGATGIVLNHRAVIKLPVDKVIPSTIQWRLGERRIDSPQSLAEALRAELGFAPHQVLAVKRHPAQPVAWGDASIHQPERWTVVLQAPGRGANVEYYVGNAYARVDRVDATAVGLLTRLHTAVGASAAWVLLADSIAGAFMLLCLTGLLLWTRLNTMRVAACVTALGAAVLAVLIL